MAPSKRERAISAAGREIEQALGLLGSNDTLARWMAYRLAETRLTADATTDPAARRAAREEQDALIIGLWGQRSVLPARVGFDRELGDALGLVTALLADNEHWAFSMRSPSSADEHVAALRGQLSTLVATVSVLLFQRQVAASGPVDPDVPMSEEEATVRRQYAALAQRLVNRATRIPGQPEPTLTEAEMLPLLDLQVAKEFDRFAGDLGQFRAVILPSEANSRSRAKPKGTALARSATKPS